MKRKNKLLAALALTLVLCLLPATMLAETYKMNPYSSEDITVKLENGEQHIYRGEKDLGIDYDPVITGAPNSNVIIKLISVDKGGTVNVTLCGLTMWTNGSPIEIGNNEHVTKAVINLEETNQLCNREVESEASVIHIESGSLTITSENGGKLVAQFTNTGYGAAIGSNSLKPCNANIRITGNADVNTFSNAGACIGGGYRGNFTRSIVIDGNAKLQGYNNGINNNLAVLGSGMEGAFTGSIEIKDNAEVELLNQGATLGQSYSPDAANAAGSVTLDDNAKIMLVDYQNNSNLYLGGAASVPGVQVKIGDGVQFIGRDGKPIDRDSDRTIVNGTLVEEPKEPAQVYYAQGELYRVVDKDGSAVAYDERVEDGVVTITAAKGASLVGALEDIQLLSRKGSTLRFVTGDVVSTVELAEFYHGVGAQTDTVVLSHNGGRTLTIGGVDYTALIK